jgi:hypothetical protein
VSEGYKDNAAPFHGYFFRILTSQAGNGAGGERSYLAGAKMTRGFAFVAYPAEYRNSGVTTFVVDSKGVIYEKDLGPQTLSTAGSMNSLSIDSPWRTVSVVQEDEAQGPDRQ